MITSLLALALLFFLSRTPPTHHTSSTHTHRTMSSIPADPEDTPSCFQFVRLVYKLILISALTYIAAPFYFALGLRDA